MSKSYTMFLASSLEKALPQRRPNSLAEPVLYGFAGEKLHFQLIYRWEEAPKSPTCLDLVGCPARVKLYSVRNIPSGFPCYAETDDNYLSKEVGKYPDLLEESNGELLPVVGEWRSLWVELDCTGLFGDQKFGVQVKGEDSLLFAENIELRLSRSRLNKQKLVQTQWFHADCLCDYYEVEAFSEEHFRICENFIAAAVKDYGINMLLTPVFTPPLDTQVGGDRRTVQLVDVALTEGGYSFDFGKLRRWAEICKRHGVEYLEIAHLFTQWGAKFCPKIMVLEDGVLSARFGWHVEATDPGYRAFLEAFIPALREELKALGYGYDRVYFHISDEPVLDNLEYYARAKAVVADLLEGAQVIDALSNYDFYAKGLVKEPVAANDHIAPFLENGVDPLWVYYCCAQHVEVSNRFFAMPSARNRIMGVLLFLSCVKGFLHWGYNFYNTQYSIAQVNPFEVSDAGGAFPSGDSYLVYPGADGQPLPSLRGKVWEEALQDLRACETLAEIKGYEAVKAMLEGLAGQQMDYKHYPKEESFFVALRKALMEALG